MYKTASHYIFHEVFFQQVFIKNPVWIEAVGLMRRRLEIKEIMQCKWKRVDDISSRRLPVGAKLCQKFNGAVDRRRT